MLTPHITLAIKLLRWENSGFEIFNVLTQISYLGESLVTNPEKPVEFYSQSLIVNSECEIGVLNELVDGKHGIVGLSAGTHEADFVSLD